MEDQRLEEAWYQAHKNDPLFNKLDENCCCRRIDPGSLVCQQPKIPDDSFAPFAFGLMCGLFLSRKDD